MSSEIRSIRSLLDNNRSNIEILPQLETFVQKVDTQSYDLEANLAVLKFYQFHPEKTQRFVVAKILVKSLMNLPNIDFSLCMYMIPEYLHVEEPIKILIQIHNLLETAQFVEFWNEAKACKEFTEIFPGFEDAIRSFIIGVVTNTYQTISKEFLSEVLNLRGVDLDAMVNVKGWKQTPETVVFPKIDTTSFKTKKIAESVKFEDLSKILGSLST